MIGKQNLVVVEELSHIVDVGVHVAGLIVVYHPEVATCQIQTKANGIGSTTPSSRSLR